jgi:hypothetical protein
VTIIFQLFTFWWVKGVAAVKSWVEGQYMTLLPGRDVKVMVDIMACFPPSTFHLFGAFLS